MANLVFRRILAVLLTLGLMIIGGMFILLLFQTRLIPTKYIIMFGAVLFLLDLAILYLTWTGDQIWRVGASAVFTIALIFCVGLLSSLVVRGVNTLDEITQVTVEVAHVGMYVRQDDPAQAVPDAKEYVFGILREQDRENTDTAMDRIAGTLGGMPEILEYDGVDALVDSLLTTGETQIIVLNSAFLGLLQDMEGYESAESMLRELSVHRVETLIESTVSDTPEESPVEPELPQEERNWFSVYISGIDSRSGLVAKSRSDVNIIATVNMDTRQIALVSTPRDFYVPLPISGGVPDKLTHAGIYGVDVSIGTLEMLYETDIDYYFRVNFSGFEGIIDALGGVTVYSDQNFTSSVTGDQFYTGYNELNGSQALAFARERKAFASGDRQRGKNQMEVIRAVIGKAVSPALLLNYGQILEEVEGSFETSVPYDLIAELVRRQLDDGGDWNVVSYSVDGYGDTQRPYSLSTNAYVMVPDYDTVSAAQALMEQVKNGEILSE